MEVQREGGEQLPSLSSSKTNSGFAKKSKNNTNQEKACSLFQDKGTIGSTKERQEKLIVCIKSCSRRKALGSFFSKLSTYVT